MSTRFKEFQGIFIPLSASDLARLCEDKELKSKYLDGIAYMHDMVVEFADVPFQRTFDTEEAIVNCGAIKERHFNQKDSLSQHFKFNFETAHYFAGQGAATLAVGQQNDVIVLQKDATAYIKALLYTYNIVRTTF